MRNSTTLLAAYRRSPRQRAGLFAGQLKLFPSTHPIMRPRPCKRTEPTSKDETLQLLGPLGHGTADDVNPT